MTLQLLLGMLLNKGTFLTVLFVWTLIEITACVRRARIRGFLALAAGFILGFLVNLIQGLPSFLFFTVSGITGAGAAGFVHFVFSLLRWNQSNSAVIKPLGAIAAIALYGYSLFVLENFVRERQLVRLSLVMSSPKVTPEQLEMVWESAGKIKHNNYRCGVAFNPRTPVRILELASKEPEYTRECLATNTSLPQNLFERLATDDSPRVRRALALNPATSATLRQRLSSDRDADVQNAVTRYALQQVKKN